jgi:UPF0755 protein
MFFPIEPQNILKQNKKKIFIFIILFVVLFLLATFRFMTQAPLDSQETMVRVTKNQNPTLVFQDLKDKKLIKSIKLIKFFLKIIDQKGGIKAGTYLIKQDTPVYKIAKQLNNGLYGIEPIKIVIREGLNNKEIALILKNNFDNFDEVSFLEKTKDKEGYLFPDTYFFYPTESQEEIIEEMSLNFDKRTEGLRESIKEEIIIMASILEGEAGGQEDINIISGILWKRLDKNMLLQVDVDRRTYDLVGLPEKPLNNPGLMSIKASLNPTNSDYYYYLHDKKGQVHFAKNYEEHLLNIKKYLKN